MCEHNLAIILESYLECALWSSTDWNTEESMDEEYSIHDFAEHDKQLALSDIESFLRLCEMEDLDLEDVSDSQIGHDFWLTRNHHGAGFWDRGLGELGNKLTKIAESFVSLDPYSDAKGFIHFN